MSNETVGLYIKLLCIDWLEDGIPKDSNCWLKLCHYDFHTFQKELKDPKEYGLAIAQLSKCFVPHPLKTNYVTNPRLQEERKKQQEHALERSESGKRGAISRWKDKDINKLDNNSSANGSAIGSANQQPMAKNGSSSSSSSSTSLKPKDKRYIIPNDFSLTDKMKEYAHGKGITNGKCEELFEAFYDWHKAKGDLMADWVAAWRTWVRNDIKFNAGKQDKPKGASSWTNNLL